MASLIKFNKIALAKASYRICSRSNYYFVLPEGIQLQYLKFTRH